MATQTLRYLELAIAQKALDEYSAALAGGDAEAIDTVACELRLRQAIDSFQWIVRAEETIRQAVYQGLVDFSAELDEAIEALYRGWLIRCEQTRALIRQQTLAGGELDNIKEFSQCRESAIDWVERHEWRKVSAASLAGRSAAEPW